MQVEKLTLFNFRNIENGSLSFSPHINLIVGPNGQGKTNLVESLHLLSTGKSFRTADTRDLIRWESESASVFADIVKQPSAGVGGHGSRVNLGVVITTKGREALVDREPVKSLSSFLGNLVAQTFSPFDLSLLRGAPLQRRMFLDRIVVDSKPGLLGAYSQATKAIKQKAALLSSGQADDSQLDTWDRILAEAASKIAPARLEAVRLLEIYAREHLASFAPDDGALELTLKSQFAEMQNGDLDEILNQLRRVRPKEKASGRVLSGPHRDDIKVSLAGHDARVFASQGQVRSIVLSLKAGALRLIEERIGDRPLVILDDFESELDSRRSAALIALLSRGSSQVFITSTQVPDALRDRIEEGDRVLNVRAGKIVE